jgi:acetolactate synthase-1/2/3 large subunit
MSYGTGERQVGSQEAPIVELVRPITKYAEVVAPYKRLDLMFSAAYVRSTMSRQGPVWIDFPVDAQWANT